MAGWSFLETGQKHAQGGSIQKNKNIFILLTALVCMPFLISGCSIGNKAQKCKNLLEEKYGEEFTVLRNWTQPLGSDVFKSEYHAVCSPVSHPEVLLEITVEDFNRKIFTDTYPQGIMAEKTSAILETALSDYFAECSVHAQCLGFCPEFTSYDSVHVESCVEQTEDPHIYFRVCVNTDVYQENTYSDEFDFLLNTIADINRSLSIHGTMTVYFLPDAPYKACVQSFQEHIDTGEAVHAAADGYYSFAFGFDDTEQIWRFTAWESLKPIAITKEDYFEMRKEVFS